MARLQNGIFALELDVGSVKIVEGGFLKKTGAIFYDSYSLYYRPGPNKGQLSVDDQHGSPLPAGPDI
jgi:hypothetical protein